MVLNCLRSALINFITIIKYCQGNESFPKLGLNYKSTYTAFLDAKYITLNSGHPTQYTPWDIIGLFPVNDMQTLSPQKWLDYVFDKKDAQCSDETYWNKMFRIFCDFSFLRYGRFCAQNTWNLLSIFTVIDDQIWPSMFFIPKDAQYSETYEKTFSNFCDYYFSIYGRFWTHLRKLTIISP